MHFENAKHENGESEAVEHLQILLGDHEIKAAEISDHDYTGEFHDVFFKFTKGAHVPAACVEAWLDRWSFVNYRPDFEAAMEKEYGAWPFAYGVQTWEKWAVSTFAQIFSTCTDTLFVCEGDNQDSLEKMYTSVIAMAAASCRQHILNVRCKHL